MKTLVLMGGLMVFKRQPNQLFCCTWVMFTCRQLFSCLNMFIVLLDVKKSSSNNNMEAIKCWRFFSLNIFLFFWKIKIYFWIIKKWTLSPHIAPHVSSIIQIWTIFMYKCEKWNLLALLALWMFVFITQDHGSLIWALFSRFY
jgi:hypothetical protein